jgi:NADH:ubiquinone oxidoreductase subunit C
MFKPKNWRIMFLGKTVPSYRVALEYERQRWSRFARALRQDEREVFDQLMDICKRYASAASNATRPVLFEAMAMTILLDQQKKINQLEKKLQKIHKQSNKP